MSRTKSERRKKEGITTEDLISITIMKIGSPTTTISMPTDSCVEDLLKQLGLSTSTEVRNGKSPLELDDILEDNDQLIIMSESKIEGGKADKEEDEDETEDEGEEADEDENKEDKEVGEDKSDDAEDEE